MGVGLTLYRRPSDPTWWLVQISTSRVTKRFKQTVAILRFELPSVGRMLKREERFIGRVFQRDDKSARRFSKAFSSNFGRSVLFEGCQCLHRVYNIRRDLRRNIVALFSLHQFSVFVLAISKKFKHGALLSVRRISFKAQNAEER